MNEADIKKGKSKLLFTLITIAVFRLALAFLMTFMAKENIYWSQWDEVYWLILGMVLLGGAATFQGSKPGRFILAGLFVIVVALEVYNFGLSPLVSPMFKVVSAPAWLAMAYAIYLIMIDSQTETYFLSQRASNYGEYTVTGPPPSNRERPQQNTHSETNNAPKKKKAKKEKEETSASWEDELDIYGED